MDIKEINDISEAFKDSFEEFFGQDVYYIPYKQESSKDTLYNEVKSKEYDETNKVKVSGIITENESLDKNVQTGKRIEKFFMITIVTKDLVDNGITHIDTNDLIEFTDAYGKTFRCSIIDDFTRVQFNNYRIFTKVKVKYYE